MMNEMSRQESRRGWLILFILLLAGLGAGWGMVAAFSVAAEGSNVDLFLPAVMRPPVPGGVVETTIPPAGGTAQVIAADGTEVLFTFPAGAVPQPQPVTLAPQEPAGGDWLTLAISPTGIPLLAPMQVLVRLPDTTTPGDDATLFYRAGDQITYLPTGVDPAGKALSATLAILGPVPADGGRAFMSEPAGTLNAAPVGCLDLINEAQAALVDLDLNEDYEAAVKLMLNSAATLSHESCDPADVQSWLHSAIDTACTAYNEAVDDAGVPVDGYDELYFVVNRIVYWKANLDVLGAGQECPEAGDYQSLIEEKFNQFVTFYDGEIDPANFPALMDEFRQVIRLRAEAAVLGLDSVEQTIVTLIQQPLLDTLRGAAYRECALYGSQLYTAELIGLLELGAVANFGLTDLYSDVHLCANSVNLDMSVGGTTVFTGTLGGGITPDDSIKSVNISTQVTGTLLIGGQVPLLTCPDGNESAQDMLLARIDGVDVAVGVAIESNLLDVPLVIDVDDALILAGYADPQDAVGQVVPLTLWRQSNACNGFYGGDEFELYTINLDFSATWFFPMGSDAQDGARGVAVDGAGNVYATGRAFDGIFQPPLGPSADAWLIAFAPDGGYRWFNAVGTEVYDEGNDVAVDNNGNVYIVGTTDGHFDGSPDDGTYGAMLARFTANGNQVWIQRLEPFGSQFARGEFVAVAANGDVIVGGRLDDGATTNAWVGRYAPDGSEIWVREQSASENVDFRDAFVAPDGAVTVAGQQESPGGGESRAGVVQYNPDGTVNWTWIRPEIPGINSWAMGVVVAADGTVFISGETNEGGSAGQVWLARLSSSGNLQWLVDAGIVDDAHNLGHGLGLGIDFVALAGVSNPFGTNDIDTWFAGYGFDGALRWAYALDIAPLDSADAVTVSPSGTICMAGVQAETFSLEDRNLWIGCASDAGRMGDFWPVGP